MPDETQMTEEDALALVNKRSTALAPEDYDTDHWSHEEDMDMSGYEGGTTPDAQTTSEEAPAAKVDPEAARRLAELEAENRRFKDAEKKRREEDFDRLLATKTPEEQVVMLKEHMAEQARSEQVERLRLTMVQDYPVATAAWGAFAGSLNMEIDDPDAYRSMMAEAETSLAAVIEGLTEKRVNERIAAEYAKKDKAWDTQGLGGAAPKAPTTSPAETAQQRYDARKEAIKASPKLDIADVQTMIREKQRLGRGGR